MSSADAEQAVRGLFEERGQKISADLSRQIRASPREMLHALITVRPPGKPITDDLLALVRKVLQADVLKRTVVTNFVSDVGARGMDHKRRNIMLWRGDLRRLGVDAVVNAANSALLGCFEPSHKCIDNVLGGAAGPELRLECFRLRRSENEPVGRALVTAAGALPAKAIVHTVGPQVARAGRPTEQHRKQLASCYFSVLDAAHERGFRSVAFPCISTGLFGYPKAEAAKVAVAAVRDWIDRNDRDGEKMHVILNAFTDEDEEALAAALGIRSEVLKEKQNAELERKREAVRSHCAAAARELRKADVVMVTTGAGLSAAAGIDYTSRELFRELYPDMLRSSQMRCMYDIMSPAAPRDDPPRLWGYLCRQVEHVRFGTEMVRRDTYSILRRLVGDRPHFCVTSNADGMLHRLGHFDAANVYERQGTYSLMQCIPHPEHPVWQTAPELARLRAGLREDGSTSAPPPVCPTCGTPAVMLQVRGGDWFTEAPQREHAQSYASFVRSLRADMRVVVLELGCGFNTPSVIRWPNEHLVRNLPAATLIRVSMDHPELPHDVRGVSIQADLHDVLAMVETELKALSSQQDHPRPTDLVL
uniref:Protein-ADP-ribose hydrolase n=1 Tax=Erythrolobus madagascarensis TaxID=708628 RepID=A0A7S0XKA2_9RHOD|mmetsp:Transcript_4783/g.10213  ORF Transcript_4783/g.10213 Transcript_4783/m.10213 type:complete len:590 (+) Transcript_4783:126-1895(+)|eukprot:CAMPEP_0185855436 /NCGR_PEP_ID=MMETSP1354-20130828/25689_1 /TAXON_ID=708628 /ORGANISM="Erythrolobus madagascarensis, Strain CCMP3276" /LENGTH=589 /DNA_ID=CAMNT_0028557459 /DNA_START=102 /DNA_END=1871 /DNA_ORIENTATION=+